MSFTRHLESRQKDSFHAQHSCAEFYSASVIHAHRFITCLELMCRVSPSIWNLGIQIHSIPRIHAQSFTQRLESRNIYSFHDQNSCAEFHSASGVQAYKFVPCLEFLYMDPGRKIHSMPRIHAQSFTQHQESRHICSMLIIPVYGFRHKIHSMPRILAQSFTQHPESRHKDSFHAQN